jgi:hypothetical protein
MNYNIVNILKMFLGVWKISGTFWKKVNCRVDKGEKIIMACCVFSQLLPINEHAWLFWSMMPSCHHWRINCRYFDGYVYKQQKQIIPQVGGQHMKCNFHMFHFLLVKYST